MSIHCSFIITRPKETGLIAYHSVEIVHHMNITFMDIEHYTQALNAYYS